MGYAACSGTHIAGMHLHGAQKNTPHSQGASGTEAVLEVEQHDFTDRRFRVLNIVRSYKTRAL